MQGKMKELNPILEVNNLFASTENLPILKGVTISVNPGEIHAIMGRNGCGKSTLSKIIAGHPSYTITKGEIPKFFIESKFVVAWNMKHEEELFPDKLACSKSKICAMERVSPLFGFFSMDHNNYTRVSLWNVMEEWGLKLANHEHFKNPDK